MPQPTPPVALDKAYALALWIIPKANRIPRNHRFILGERLYGHSIGLVQALTRATFSKDKAKHLDAATDDVNQLRLLLRLAKDLGALPFEAYEHGTEHLDEIGRMAGGWRKSMQ